MFENTLKSWKICEYSRNNRQSYDDDDLIKSNNGFEFIG